jgi:hypothetical protein
MTRSTMAGVLVTLVALAGVPAYASPTDDVRAVMMRFVALSSYQMSFGTGAKSGTIDVAKPDSMHMHVGSTEMIRIGSTTYVKAGPRGWMKLAAMPGTSQATIADEVRAMSRDANDFSVVDLGMKSIGGETLHGYRLTQKKNGTQSTIYVGGDGMIHRMAGAHADANLRFGKFNQIAPIRAPI